MNLGIGQTGRLAIAHRAHRPEVAGDIAAQRAGAARPPAQAAQGIQAPVDRGGAPPGGDHVLAVGDQLELGEAVEREPIRLDHGAPGEEVPQIVAIAAQRRRREVLTCQAVKERHHPGRVAYRQTLGRRCLYCTQCDPPVSPPSLLRARCPLWHGDASQSGLHSMIARNKPAVRDGTAPEMANPGWKIGKITPRGQSLACTFTRMGLPAQVVGRLSCDRNA